jgi:probable F420-dependent oxidoreductase
MELGRLGIFSTGLRGLEPAEYCARAAEYERLGYGALWITGGPMVGDVLDVVERMLGATEHLVVAPAVVNIWAVDPARIAARHHEIATAFPGRFLLGLGVSHHTFVEARGEAYTKPVERIAAFLDDLDAAIPPVPREERFLAALAPRMLRLARERSAGSLPYFYSPEQTAEARRVLGPDRMLAVELPVALVDDADEAHHRARLYFQRYLDRPNYTNNLRKQGFTDADFADGGSDRLFDASVAWGNLDAIAARIRELTDAGADHVPVQVLSHDLQGDPIDDHRRLSALIGR